MRKKIIDLHIHSTYSDGILTPTEIVTCAKKNHVQLIALTDHDTTDGITEFLSTAKREQLPAIYGIEFTCKMNGRDLHILGYNFSLSNQRIQQLINNFKELQDLYTLYRILNFEKNFGQTIDLTKIPQKGNLTPIRLAYWLLENGQIAAEDFPQKNTEVYDLFADPLNSTEMEYLSHLPLAEDVVKIIREADGFAVLAHPQNMEVTFAELLRLYACGLNGIEAFYPDQNPQIYLNWAKKLNLTVTAGTDYHGVLDRNERSIGFTLPEELPENIYIYSGDISL